jgi:DNA repair protein RadC
MNDEILYFPDFEPTQPGEHGFTMACREQPQQRVENFGVHAASDTELVALMLHGNGTTPEQTVFTAARLLVAAGSLGALLSWVPADYRRLKGVSHAKGLQLAAIAEIGRRMMMTVSPAPLLNRPELIAAHFAPLVTGLAVEKFWVLLLDRKNRLLKQVEVSSGTATAALAHPREVFRAALRESGPVAAVACVHNHPSGYPEPSAADINTTRLLREASRAVDIELVDHVIVGRASADPTGKGYFSFKSAGML